MLKTIEGIFRSGTIKPAPEVASLRVVTIPKKHAMGSIILTLMLLFISRLLGLGATSLGIAQQALLQADTSGSSNPTYSTEIRRQLSGAILSNPDLPLVLEQAKAILKTGLNAGSGYGEVWIRDLNTFIELALDVQDRQQIRQSLLVFFHFQGTDGGIIDGYIPTEAASGAYAYIQSATMPEFRGHKNTVETDQESSLIQALYRYVEKTRDRSILDERINGLPVRQRLSLALHYLLEHRTARSMD
jgi:hypothetical protein